MTRFRTFRNPDMPALVALWNRAAPGSAVARPLTVHEFDGHVVSQPLFDAEGLILAEKDDRIVGFAHAGFGPENLLGPPWRLSHELGTTAMLVVEPSSEADEHARGLLSESERYLRARGAKVLYAGGQFPVNPFYWGVYGGSECAGILGAPDASPFSRAATSAGYEPVAATMLMELDLTFPEPRDPRAVLHRRQTRLEIVDDPVPANWWEGLAVSEFRPAVVRLLTRLSPAAVELARATLWDMDWFGRLDGRSRIGLFGMEVPNEFRRKGFARFLLSEVGRLARDQGATLLCAQTAATNLPALALYQSAGFTQVENAHLYRLPGRSP
ncbi:MAG: GNAT family N-acetyltransferase [Isosphaeraceae bacterium]